MILTRRRGTSSNEPGTGVAVRGVWGVVDQGLSSLSNLGLTIAVAASSDAHSFGAFSVAYLMFFLCLGVARALSQEPLLVTPPDTTAPCRATRAAGSSGASLVLAVVAALVLAAAGAALGDRTGGPIVVFAICVPGLFLQDAGRYVLFSQGRPAAAAANDLLWCVLQLGGFLALRLGGGGSVTTYVLIWGASASACAAVGVLQSGVRPRWRSGTRWVRAERALGIPFAAEFLVYSGSGHLALLLLAALDGLAGVGAFRAALALFGPLQVLVVGLNMVALTEGARMAESPGLLRRTLVGHSVACGALGLAWGAALLAVPTSFGSDVLGPTWAGARELIPHTALFVALWNATAAPAAGLRVLRSATRSLRTRVLTCALLLAFSLFGAGVAGAKGAVSGFAASQAIALVLWWRAFVTAQVMPARRRAGLHTPAATD